MGINESSGRRLPEEVKKLIARKIEVRRDEEVQLFAAATALAYSKLHQEILVGFVGRKFYTSFVSAPMVTFHEIVNTATDLTKRWPRIVWESIVPILSAVQFAPSDNIELNAIMDELSWSTENKSFRHSYIDPAHFSETISRIFSRYAGQRPDHLQREFDVELESAALLAKCQIFNAAIRARNEIGILIDEYVIAQLFVKGKSAQNMADDNNRLCTDAHPSGPIPASSDHCQVFRNMEKLTANDVSLALVGDKLETGVGANNLLEISARGLTRHVALAAIGLIDLNRGGLNSQGIILLGMAQKKKITNPALNKKRISRLRKLLCIHLGINTDPFERYRKGEGWKPSFQIEDKRGAADERAKKEAEFRTVSFDQFLESGEKIDENYQTHQPFDLENDPAGNWLASDDLDPPG